MKSLLLYFSFFFLIVACTQQQEQKPQNTFAPKVVEAHGYVVPKDSMAEPKVIPAGKPKTINIKLQTLKVIPTNTNIHIAGKPKIIIAGTPRIITPGTDTFPLPKTTPLSFGEGQGVRSVVAGIPEVVIAKDPYIRDNNPQNFSSFSKLQGLKHDVIRCMLQDQSGNLWFGTNGGGVSKYDGKSFTNFTEKEGLSNNIVLSMLQDQSGNLWFGTSGGGVSKYDGKSFTNFTEKEGLSNNIVWSMLQDQSGNLWFGTYGGGVSKYDGKSFTNFTEKEGLSNNYVFAMLLDKNDNLWFGTRFGLCKLAKSKMAKLEGGDTLSGLRGHEGGDLTGLNGGKELILFKSYGYEDGFLGIGVNGGNTGKNIYEASDGTIWLAANDRLTAYHPEGDEPDTIPPNVQLTSIELFNENIAWVNLTGLHKPVGGVLSGLNVAADTSFVLGNGVSVGNFEFDGLTRWYNLPENLSLAYNNNYLTFNFIGITQLQSKKVKYQYKLEGIDENWSAITNRTEAPYGNLPQGSYTFKVKAMNSEGVWCRDIACYVFTIRPPWWLTWWFKTLMVLSLLFVVYSYIKWRERKLKKDKELLEKKVNEQTHELSEKNEELNQQNEEIITQKDEITAQRDLVTQQKDELETVNTELEKLSIVASETDNAVIICNKEGKFEWVNKGFEKLYSLTLEQFTAKHGKTIYETSSNPAFKEVVNEAVKNNRSITYNSQFTKATGETLWLQTTLTPIFEEANSPVSDEIFIAPTFRSGDEIFIAQPIVETTEEVQITDSPDRDETLVAVNEDVKKTEEVQIADSPDRDEILVAPTFRSGLETNHKKALHDVKLSKEKQLPATQRNGTHSLQNLKKLVAIESDITKVKEAEEEISKQKKQLEEIYKEVSDSINYATRLQSAILPDINILHKHVAECFILFKPKDKVSGDFYWFASVENQLVITVADCTGHGVPGAFMSMLGMGMLKEIVVKEYITQPDVILKKLRKEVIKALGQTGASGEQKDGMDMSLCSINTETYKLQWAGANNPLYIVRKNLTGFETRGHAPLFEIRGHAPLLLGLEEIKGDKMPIAIYDKMDKFTLHEIPLKKGDIIYLTGDGFSDQFGGPKGKKFMSKNLKELLLKISAEPMKTQHEILDKTITDWINGHGEKYEQTDDITIMGIKI